MAVKVRLPVLLRRLAGNQAVVEASGETVIDVIEDLNINYPGIKERLCDEEGRIRKFINVYVNTKDIRFLDREKTRIEDGDEISMVPAIAGG